MPVSFAELVVKNILEDTLLFMSEVILQFNATSNRMDSLSQVQNDASNLGQTPAIKHLSLPAVTKPNLPSPNYVSETDVNTLEESHLYFSDNCRKTLYEALTLTPTLIPNHVSASSRR